LRKLSALKRHSRVDSERVLRMMGEQDCAKVFSTELSRCDEYAATWHLAMIGNLFGVRMQSKC